VLTRIKIFFLRPYFDMADYLIIGNAASVVNIVDVLARTISAVRELLLQWEDAEFTCLNLLAQLTALKAALTKIEEWRVSEIAEAHHQLTMDLDDSVACCRILVRRLDTLLSGLPLNPDGTLNLSAKTKILFRSGSMDDLQKLIERQTNALILLLTACNL
jgi:guanine nucleotide-binding protein G(i) subunit alpha